MSKTVIAKYVVNGEPFEIFVNSDAAYEYMTGVKKEVMSALEVDEVFKDANKGERTSNDKLQKAFGTTDITKIADIILKKGNVPITTEQRNKLIEEKRKQIVTIISRNSIDPRTNAPHTILHIENAMAQAKVAVDPMKSASEQVDPILKKIEMIIPIKFANVKIGVKIGAAQANRCYGILKQYGIKSEQWLSDGSLEVIVEFPAGLQAEFFDKINKLTAGSAETKILGV